MSARRPTTPVFAAFGLLLALAGGAAVHAAARAPAEAARIAASAALVRDLGLTDLALFTEARFTRHPALADLATAFMDAPAALDHFPSGSLMPPPEPGQIGQYGQSALGVSAQEIAR